MNRRLIGARAMGLATEWRFGFAGFGDHADTTPGAVFLDVGGATAPGVLDHHSGENDYKCTTEIVFARRELVYNHLLADWLRIFHKGGIAPGSSWSPVLITHRNPDWDSLVACHLAIRLVEDGDFPTYAAELVEYTREVDQGRYAMTGDAAVFAPHIAYLAVQNLKPNGRKLESVEQLTRGLELIERVTSVVMTARAAIDTQLPGGAHTFYPGSPGADTWRDDPWFEDIVALLQQDAECYARDLARALIMREVLAPALDSGSPIPVSAFVATQPMECILHKYWVRADGFPYFCCPSEAPAGSLVYPRVVLSVDPNFEVGGRSVCLRGLGYTLERSESELRHGANGGMDDRHGPARFPDGYCDNCDPWFDGRGFNHTIVDAPNSGTRLAYQKIVELATASAFWEVPLQHATVSLVFASHQETNAAVAAETLMPPGGMAATLEPYFAACRSGVRPWTGDLASLPNGSSVTCAVRRFPAGTCEPFRIVTVTTRAGTSIEALIEIQDRIAAQEGRQPDYVLAEVTFGRHLPDPVRVKRLVRLLANGEVSEVGPLTEGDEMVLFNSRSVVRQSRTPRSFELEQEIMFYLAFLNETLIRFSQRISELLPDGPLRRLALAAEPLDTDFLRFQARYYQIEFCRAANGRLLAEHLSASLNLGENYAEVRSEVDRLAQLEAQLADKRRLRSERSLQAVLAVVAISGVYQTLLAFWSANKTTFEAPLFWVEAIGLPLLAALLYWFFSRGRSGGADR